jgi:hypothetical protein
VPPYEDWEIGFSSRSDDQLFDRRAGYWISIGSPVSSFHAFFWLGEQGLDPGLTHHFSLGFLGFS